MAEEPRLFGEIFNERGALLAFFGALGGAVRSATLKTSWMEALRVVFIGAGSSFGVGALAPMALPGHWISVLPADVKGTLGALCAAAFLVGLVAVNLVERLVARKKGGRVDGE